MGGEIPVTGAAGPFSSFPWALLIASILLLLLIYVLVTRRTVEASPSVAGPSKITVSAPPSAVSPAAAPVAASPETRNQPAPMRYEYTKGMETIPPFEAPPIYDRSYEITVDVNRPTTRSNGVLLSMGSMQAGYGMYLQDSRLIFEQAQEGMHERMVSIIPAPIGASTLRFRFMRTAPFQGIGTLYIDGRMVNSMFFERTLSTPPAEGMDIGHDGGTPLTDAYIPPYPFEGSLIRVVFEISSV